MKYQLAISVLTQHKRRAQKHAPSYGSLTQDLAAEDDCNSPTDEVYVHQCGNSDYHFSQDEIKSIPCV